jgi:hypothetical protein
MCICSLPAGGVDAFAEAYKGNPEHPKFFEQRNQVPRALYVR